MRTTNYMITKPDTVQNWQDYLFVTLAVACLFAIGLGIPPLSVPDGGRYAEIPREMIELGDYITPHLNYLKYFEKPVLFYWLQCAAIHLFGFNTWALRLPTAAMGVLGCVLTFFASVKLLDRRSAIFATLILATSLLYFFMAHFITLDMTVSVFLSATMLFFILAMQSAAHSPRRRAYAYAMYIASALAVLTKGLIGILLPGMVFFIWILVMNRWRDLKTFYIPSGILLFCAIAAPWHIIIQSRHPEFFHFYFIEQQFHRYLTYSAGRYKGPWFFIPVLILGAFPWTGFLIGAIKSALPDKLKNYKKYQLQMFLLIWAFSLFIFFSISKSQLVPYLLPIFPALAMLIGNYLHKHWDQKNKPLLWHSGVYTSALMFVFGAIIISILPNYFTVADPIIGMKILYSIVIILSISAIAISILQACKQYRKAIAVIAITSTFTLTMSFACLDYLRDFSVEPLALWLKPRLTKSDMVVTYKTYYQDLPVYLKRRIVIASWQNELTFGMNHQADSKKWMIDLAEFHKRWLSHERVYAMMEKYDYEALKAAGWKMFLLKEANKQVLTTNRERQP